jgi:hypothetical protein
MLSPQTRSTVLAPGHHWLRTGFGGALHLLLAAAALGSVILLQRAQLNQAGLIAENPQQAERQESLRLKALGRIPAGGLTFNNLIADGTFLSFLQYYGDDEARKQTGYSISPQYFDVITRRDPRFVESYLFLSGVLSYQLGQPDLAMQYRQRGTDVLSPQQHPGAAAVWEFQALDRLLLTNDVPGAIAAYEQAASWAAASTDPEVRKVESVFRRFAAFLKTDPDSRLIRFTAWVTIYQQAVAIRDQATQTRVRQAILDLGGTEFKNTKGELDFRPPSAAAKLSPAPSSSPTAIPTPSPTANGPGGSTTASPVATPVGSPTASPAASPAASPVASPTASPAASLTPGGFDPQRSPSPSLSPSAGR